MTASVLRRVAVDGVRTLATLVGLWVALWLPAELAATAATASGFAWLTTGFEGRVLYVAAASVGLASLYAALSLYYYARPTE